MNDEMERAQRFLAEGREDDALEAEFRRRALTGDAEDARTWALLRIAGALERFVRTADLNVQHQLEAIDEVAAAIRGEKP